MNTYVHPREIGGREAAMWLCVDRIEGNTVVLLDEKEEIYRMDRAAYVTMVGRAPAESDILSAEAEEGSIRKAVYDPEETASRKAAARARLNRLFGKK
jgi:hypothetical protein